MLLKKNWDKVTGAVNFLLTPLRVLWDIFKKIYHVLFGGSLIPALELLASVIKTLVMPALIPLQIALEGIKMIIGSLDDFLGILSGTVTNVTNIMKQSFTQVFNFMGSGFDSFKDKASDAFGGIKSGLKKFGGLF